MRGLLLYAAHGWWSSTPFLFNNNMAKPTNYSNSSNA